MNVTPKRTSLDYALTSVERRYGDGPCYVRRYTPDDKPGELGFALHFEGEPLGRGISEEQIRWLQANLSEVVSAIDKNNG